MEKPPRLDLSAWEETLEAFLRGRLSTPKRRAMVRRMLDDRAARTHFVDLHFAREAVAGREHLNPSSTCEDFRKRLPTAMSGALEPATLFRELTHLDDCAACTKFMRAALRARNDGD